MKTVWAVADSIVSPLGSTTEENFRNVGLGHSGIKPISSGVGGQEMFLAGVVEESDSDGDLTHFENICVHALNELFSQTKIDGAKTLLILSTTKGNVDLLEKGQSDHPRIHLPATGQYLQKRFGFAKHLVISNACISGSLAIVAARRFINAGQFEYVVVVGADVLSKFIISGFQSLLALSNEPCRPFDANRKGINLGEGAGAVLLTSRPEDFPSSIPVRVCGASSSNDANHISGPSRTGGELAAAVNNALLDAQIDKKDVDFISAHGTATLYNDEMEAKAFDLCGLNETPLHSLKGYYGHTLGAAGVIETIIGIQSLRTGVLIPCLGYDISGVSRELNVIKRTQQTELKTFLKTSSGFGGCNAAIVLQK
jgi:3-oxoacyl-[acyl-carrier-protein] synthase I